MKKLLIFILLLFCKNCLSQWSDVGLGTDNRVTALYVDSSSNKLFVGGPFQHAGNILTNSIATWDGAIWNSFGSNIRFSSPGYVNAIVNFNGTMIVAGDFDSIGSMRVNNIARWDGTDWQPMGSGFNNGVTCLIVYNGDLYAGGAFFNSGTDTLKGFARWSGTNWVNEIKTDGTVFSMAIYQGKLILAGNFLYSPNGFYHTILGWNGNSVDTSIPGYFNDAIFSIYSYRDTLYATGAFTAIPLNNSNYISVYYNNLWHSIGNPTGASNWIKDAIIYHNKLYMCGYFLTPPDLCEYNGSGFDSVADVQGFVDKLIEYKGELYAAGAYNSLNGNIMNNLSKYNDANIFINEISGSGINLQIFPNPSLNGKINLSIMNQIRVDKMYINIYSSDNKLIYSEKSNEFISEISLRVKKGVYILEYIINEFKNDKIKLIII